MEPSHVKVFKKNSTITRPYDTIEFLQNSNNKKMRIDSGKFFSKRFI